MDDSFFTSGISRHIWETKYRYRSGRNIYDWSIEDTWYRVARALAATEAGDPAVVGRRSFYNVLQGFRFCPADVSRRAPAPGAT